MVVEAIRHSERPSLSVSWLDASMDGTGTDVQEQFGCVIRVPGVGMVWLGASWLLSCPSSWAPTSKGEMMTAAVNEATVSAAPRGTGATHFLCPATSVKAISEIDQLKETRVWWMLPSKINAAKSAVLHSWRSNATAKLGGVFPSRRRKHRRKPLLWAFSRSGSWKISRLPALMHGVEWSDFDTAEL